MNEQIKRTYQMGNRRRQQQHSQRHQQSMRRYQMLRQQELQRQQQQHEKQRPELQQQQHEKQRQELQQQQHEKQRQELQRQELQQQELQQQELQQQEKRRQEKRISDRFSVKISIVMAYYNRKEQLLLTLNSFEKLYGSRYNLEVIIVDDMSDDNEKIYDIVKSWSFKIKLIELKNKTWLSPVIPYNVGINHIAYDTDIIILQNPEIFHCGNILEHAIENIPDDTYLTYPVFASPSFNHNTIIRNHTNSNTTDYYNDFIKKIDYSEFGFDYEFYIEKYEDIKHLESSKAYNHFIQIGGREGRICNKHGIFFNEKIIYKCKGWFNHIAYNPRNFHFLSAMSKSVLDKIGGFCNEMAYGMWYDDDDLLNRIKKVTQVKTVDSNVEMGIHLYHKNSTNENIFSKNIQMKINENYKIFQKNINNNIIYCDPTLYITERTDDQPVNNKDLQPVLKMHWKEVYYINFSQYNYEYGYFYRDKLNVYLDYIRKLYPKISICGINHNLFIFGNGGSYKDENSYLGISKRLEIKENITYIFDEISYPHLLGCYVHFPKFRKDIKTFIENVKYIVFFCELFENTKLKTIGNSTTNIEFASMFFRNSIQNIMCNYNNISILKQLGIIENTIYFPPLGYMNSKILQNKQKNIDILIYGNVKSKRSYRYLEAEKIKLYCNDRYIIKNYLKIPKQTTGIFHENLNNMLLNTKMVIHIAIFSNLKTFPWAKCSKLFSSKVFILIENNSEVEILKAKGLNVATYNPFVKADIFNKIDFYLKNSAARETHIESCYNFMKNNYNMEDFFNKFLFTTSIPKINVSDISMPKIYNDYNKIEYFSFKSAGYHTNQKKFILNIFNNEKVETEAKVCIPHHWKYYEYFWTFLKTYKSSVRTLWVLNAVDLYYMLSSCFLPEHFTLMEHFLKNTNYILFHYEVITNDTLNQVGCEKNRLSAHPSSGEYYFLSAETSERIKNILNNNVDPGDNTVYVNKIKRWFTIARDAQLNSDFLELNSDFLKKGSELRKKIYQYAQYIFTSLLSNVRYISPYNKNTIYQLPMGYSILNNYVPLIKSDSILYDVVFYGNLCKGYCGPEWLPICKYRMTILEGIKNKCEHEKLRYLYSDTLFDIKKNNILQKTEIVIHIPLMRNLRHIPWQKIAELMSKKVFFIIEECEDMYELKLDNILVYYKRNDDWLITINNLFEKIKYYLHNKDEMKIKIEENFNYIKKNHNIDEYIRNLY